MLCSAYLTGLLQSKLIRYRRPFHCFCLLLCTCRRHQDYIILMLEHWPVQDGFDCGPQNLAGPLGEGASSLWHQHLCAPVHRHPSQQARSHSLYLAHAHCSGKLHITG